MDQGEKYLGGDDVDDAAVVVVDRAVVDVAAVVVDVVDVAAVVVDVVRGTEEGREWERGGAEQGGAGRSRGGAALGWGAGRRGAGRWGMEGEARVRRGEGRGMGKFWEGRGGDPAC